MRIKSLLWSGVFLLFPFWGIAQVSSQNYSLFYQRQHLFYHLGNEMNVMDVDVEWPEFLNFSEEKPLQEFLARKVFGVEGESFVEAYPRFLKRFGKPVAGPLDTIPDDDRFCYITCQLHVLGTIPGRFISFKWSAQVVPGRLSSQTALDSAACFTYDLLHGKILYTGDLLRLSRIQDGESERSAWFRQMLFSHLQGGVPEGFEPDGIAFEAFLKKSEMAFKVYLRDDDGQVLKTDSYIPYTDLTSFMSKTLKDGLRTPIPVHLPEGERTDPYLDSGKVYTVLDTMPEYIHGDGRIDGALSHVLSLRPDIVRNLTGHRVIIRFLVEPDGTLSHIRVLVSAEPSLDRDIVDALRALPKWKPGYKDGKPVRTCMTLPIVVRQP